MDIKNAIDLVLASKGQKKGLLREKEEEEDCVCLQFVVVIKLYICLYERFDIGTQ